MDPLVSFVVPCYKLGHFLKECVDSILQQTYYNFEIVIMDDCSPDDTPKIASSFDDVRVKYVRNKVNLGHLRNYNEGIALTQGKYVWLISADDCLRKDYVVSRYVNFLEGHPEVGFVFCQGISLEGGKETGLIGWWGDHDIVFKGHDFVCKALTEYSMLVVPSVMARRDCYGRSSMFPLDMPHRGDTYMWCRWALEFDVGYFVDPMVSYRFHEQSMMSTLKAERPTLLIRDQIAVYWKMKKLADDLGYQPISDTCLSCIAKTYAYGLLSDKFALSQYRISFEEFEQALRQNVCNAKEACRIRARVNASVGDGCYVHKDSASASRFYRIALSNDVAMPAVWGKYCLLQMGPLGEFARSAARRVRRNRHRTTRPERSGNNTER